MTLHFCSDGPFCWAASQVVLLFFLALALVSVWFSFYLPPSQACFSAPSVCTYYDPSLLCFRDVVV